MFQCSLALQTCGPELETGYLRLWLLWTALIMGLSPDFT